MIESDLTTVHETKFADPYLDAYVRGLATGYLEYDYVGPVLSDPRSSSIVLSSYFVAECIIVCVMRLNAWGLKGLTQYAQRGLE